MTRLLLLAITLLALAAPLHAQSLTVGGTGSSEPLIRKLFDEFRKQAPDATLTVIAPPLGSGGALKALGNGRIDLAIIGRPITPEEQAKVGRATQFAVTPLVLASRNGLRRGGFTLDELAAVYDGRIKQWEQAKPLRLILRASFESDTLVLKSMSPAMSQAVTAASQRLGMAMGDNDQDTLELIARTDGSLGPTTLGLIATTGTSGLTLHTINGQTPSLATLKNGNYPWYKPLAATLPLKPSPMAERFVSFLQSGAARVIMQRYDYLPATP